VDTKNWKTRYNEVISLGKKRKFVDAFKSGEKYYNSSVSMFPVIENGETIQIAVFVKNVNVEIADERAAYPLGNDFQQLVEKSDVAFWIWNNGRVLYVNSAYEEITQSPRSEFYKNPESALRLVHPDDIASLLDKMTSYSYLKKGTLKEEFRVKQPDGTYRWVMARTFPMSSEGNSKKILGIAEDISEIKEKEFAQEALSAKLTGILESTSDMVFAIDKSYRYTAFNQKYASYIQEYYGISIEIGENALNIFSSDTESNKVKIDFDRALLE
jgi:PAS domain S-box-containing protein